MLRILDKPQIRWRHPTVCLRACGHYKWETVFRSKVRRIQVCPCSVLSAQVIRVAQQTPLLLVSWRGDVPGFLRLYHTRTVAITCVGWLGWHWLFSAWARVFARRVVRASALHHLEFCSFWETCMEVYLKRASLGMFTVSVIAHVTSTQKDCWIWRLSFRFLHLMSPEGRDSRREQGLGSELQTVFPVSLWICFRPFFERFRLSDSVS